MLRMLATRNLSKNLALSVAIAVTAFSGDIHSYAANGEESLANPASKAVVESAAAQSTADTPEAAPTLLTREQMLEAMIEAERLRSAAARPDPAINNKEMLAKWGVRVLGTSYAADGFWIVFRFHVDDVDKAKPLFDSKIKPYLMSEKTGVKMAVPEAAKIGSLRTTDRGGNIKEQKIYTIMFANPAFQVAPGERVSVVIGDFKAEHMTVQGKRTNMSVKPVQSADAKPSD